MEGSPGLRRAPIIRALEARHPGYEDEDYDNDYDNEHDYDNDSRCADNDSEGRTLSSGGKASIVNRQSEIVN